VAVAAQVLDIDGWIQQCSACDKQIKVRLQDCGRHHQLATARKHPLAPRRPPLPEQVIDVPAGHALLIKAHETVTIGQHPLTLPTGALDKGPAFHGPRHEADKRSAADEGAGVGGIPGGRLYL
jgi:hypothetical protein